MAAAATAICPKLYIYDINGPTYGASYIATGDNSTTAISASWYSKEFNVGFASFKHIVIYLAKQSAGSLTVSWSVDQGTYVSNTVDMTVGRGNMIRKVLDVNQRGSTIQLRITQAVAAQTFTVYAAQIFFDPDPSERLA